LLFTTFFSFFKTAVHIRLSVIFDFVNKGKKDNRDIQAMTGNEYGSKAYFSRLQDCCW